MALKYLVSCVTIILIPIIFWENLPFVSVVSKLFFTLSFILLKVELKCAVYKLFLEFFVILLCLGIIEWLLLLFGVNFFWALVNRADMLDFHQGLFILAPTYYSSGYARFMSLCEEPGNLGTICFFLIITLDFQRYKKQFLVLLLAGLITFSLGFYVLITLWVLTQIKKLKFYQIIIGFIAIIFMLTLFGDAFNDRIVERILNKNNIEELDNRTNDQINNKLQEISYDYRLFVGMGNRNYYEWKGKMGGVSAGAKNFLLQYGALGLVVVIYSFSMLIIRVRGFNRQTLLLVFFVCLCFYKSDIWNYPPVILPLLTVSLESMISHTYITNKIV